MKMGIYVVRDCLTLNYDFFGVFVNDAVAIRAFKEACKGAGVPASDLSLYLLCEYDTKKGLISDGKENATFICEGVKDE